MHNTNHNSTYLRTQYILIGLLVIAGIYLIADHGQHMVPYLPFAFLLGCFFMHLFMHGGHEKHGSKNNQVENKSSDGYSGHSY